MLFQSRANYPILPLFHEFMGVETSIRSWMIWEKLDISSKYRTEPAITKLDNNFIAL